MTTETKQQTDRVAYTIPEFAARFGKKRHWGYTRVRKGDVRVIEGYGEKMIPASEIERILNAGGAH